MPATPAADEIGNIFGFPSAEADRARQAFTPEQGPGRRPEVPLNLGFGAGTFTSDDFAGFNTGNPTVMDPFYVSGGSINPYGADLSGFNYYMPGFGYTDFFVTPGAGENFGGGLLGRPAGTSTPTILDPYTVTGTRINDPSLLGIDPNAPYLGPRAPFQIDPTDGGAGVVTLPPVVVRETALGGTGNLNLLGYDPNASFVGPVANPNATTDGETVTLPPFVVTDTKDKVSTEQPNWFRDYIAGRTTSPTPVYMNPYFVEEPKVKKPDENVTFVDPFQTATNKNAPRVGDLTLVDDTTKTKKDDSTKIDLGGPKTTPTNAGTVATGTGTSTAGVARRNIGAELKETMAALQANEPAITSMYKGLYESFMPDTLRTAASSGLAQLRSDEEKLARLRAGILSPEDVRTAQQGAREAYAARGQVMGPGAVGAEILNRENIRQSREDAARAAYNQSIGNVLNTANLQTGNIFQPIGNLISGTFNPLGSYPADVYGTNVNADLATMISDKNYAAAIESAKLAGAAGKSAATTSAVGQVGSAALPFILTSLFCWIAREVYGVDNPKWLKFRTWMFTQAPGWFFRWYMDNGERFADWLRRNPWMKPAIRFWMDSRIRSMENQIIFKEAF